MKPEARSQSIVPISAELLRLLRGSRHILILSHHNPDGDAIGSSVALASALSAQGRRADLFLAGSWAHSLEPFLEGVSLNQNLDRFQDYDLILLLDCHCLSRLGPAEALIRERLAALSSPPPIAVVDHHPSDGAEKLEAVGLHQPGASSTGELIWRLLKSLDWLPQPAGRQALLLALASDTGFFAQANTTAESLAAAADLLRLGGSLADIHRRIRQGLPLRRLKLMGLALNDLSLHFGGRLAVISVTEAMLRQAEAQMSDTEDFVELGRSLAGVSLSALIKDPGLGVGQVRVSLRSQDSVDASALAAFFGGGGHRQAAAYTDAEAAGAAEAKARLLAEAERFL